MRDVYGILTDRIVASLEAGVQPWFKPWQSERGDRTISRPLRFNGKPYRGVNVLSLWLAAELEGYTNPYWMTYRQAQALGAQVRKGEHGTLVIFAKRETVNEGTDNERQVFKRSQSFVFNCDQIDNLPEKFRPVPTPPIERPKHARIIEADTFFGHLGMDLRHGGSQAYYSPSRDFVQMPHFDDFATAADYYCTLGHETTHWTKHEKRLQRDLGKVKRWGDEAYAMEELVAELGAAFCAADIGIMAKPRAGHASYIAQWLKVLKNDKTAIFTAASHAEKALKFMHERQPGYVPDEDQPAKRKVGAKKAAKPEVTANTQPRRAKTKRKAAVRKTARRKAPARQVG